MKRVSASEHDLLTVARGLVGQLGAAAVEPLLRCGRALPAGIGETAAGLLREVLARGVVLSLCRRGGWRPAKHLCEVGAGAGVDVVQGRLWNRRAAPELRFGRSTLSFLRWLVEQPLGGGGVKPFTLGQAKPSLADELVLALGCDLLRRAGCAGEIGASPAVRDSALCWLCCPELLAEHGALPAAAAALAGFERLASGDGATVVEAISQELAARWVAIDRAKARISEPARLTALGESQARVLEALAIAADAAGRRDLLVFSLEAVGELLRHRPAPRRWVAALSHRGRLAERQEAARAAGALLDSVDRIHGWIEQARQVRFFDDEYDAAQLLLEQWELVGAAGHEQACQVIRSLAALSTPTDDQAAGPS